MLYFYYKKGSIILYCFEVFPKIKGYGRKGIQKIKSDLVINEFNGKIILKDYSDFVSGFFTKMRDEGLIDILNNYEKKEESVSKKDLDGFEYSDGDEEEIKTNYDFDKKILKRQMIYILTKEEVSIKIIDKVYDELNELVGKN